VKEWIGILNKGVMAGFIQRVRFEQTHDKNERTSQVDMVRRELRTEAAAIAKYLR
jgi:hypothetical protein